MKTRWGIAILGCGLCLLAVPFWIFRDPNSFNAPGDGGPNFLPIFQSMAAVGGAVVFVLVGLAFIFGRKS